MRSALDRKLQKQNPNSIVNLESIDTVNQDTIDVVMVQEKANYIKDKKNDFRLVFNASIRNKVPLKASNCMETLENYIKRPDLIENSNPEWIH